jgi:hypothetical protein
MWRMLVTAVVLWPVALEQCSVWRRCFFALNLRRVWPYLVCLPRQCVAWLFGLHSCIQQLMLLLGTSGVAGYPHHVPAHPGASSCHAVLCMRTVLQADMCCHSQQCTRPGL